MIMILLGITSVPNECKFYVAIIVPTYLGTLYILCLCYNLTYQLHA